MNSLNTNFALTCLSAAAFFILTGSTVKYFNSESEKTEAAIKIQKAVRSYLVQQEVEETQGAARTLQRFVNVHNCKVKLQERQNAAVKIQNFIRIQLSKEVAHELVVNGATTKIQSILRTHLELKKYEIMKKKLEFSLLPNDIKIEVFKHLELVNYLSLMAISQTCTAFHNHLKDRLIDETVLNNFRVELIKKYNIYRDDVDLPKEPDLLPSQLLDAVASGLNNPCLKRTFPCYKKEIERDLKWIIKLIPNSVNCPIGEFRSLYNLTPLAVACCNENIPASIIELLLKNGANGGATFSEPEYLFSLIAGRNYTAERVWEIGGLLVKYLNADAMFMIQKFSEKFTVRKKSFDDFAPEIKEQIITSAFKTNVSTAITLSKTSKETHQISLGIFYSVNRNLKNKYQASENICINYTAGEQRSQLSNLLAMEHSFSDEEFNKDIQCIIHLHPSSINCLHEISFQSTLLKVTPLVIACLNKSISPETIKILIESGAQVLTSNTPDEHKHRVQGINDVIDDIDLSIYLIKNTNIYGGEERVAPIIKCMRR